MTRFGIATCDELWVRGRCIERRLSHGEAVEDEHGIVATDTRDDALVAAAEAAMAEMRSCVLPDLRMRLVAEARFDGVTSTITATLAGHSVVTSPEHLDDDVALLRNASAPCALRPALSLPLLWRNGTAAVLLHEAIGHPAEHGHAEIAWPAWLAIENPLAPRRASFRDVPLLRMTNLVARQHDAPFALPDERIEVLLVDGGSYEPLTEVVTLRIAAADIVRRDEVQRADPFTLTATRGAVAGALIGATGPSIRYPGVICSREGQELVVGSHAPVMLTEPLA